ncbi:hypothetical protein GALL_376710 [mine drainage metagenome]|jgi:ABC-type branched-subunit amino acid transport system substrate-binding protein|uniref:Leucine-binding protein domain-containing protein n=1 Tax=mine drainage metagenome TaxID=410659 RepID=A0A1J5QA97_9ZZZZ
MARPLLLPLARAALVAALGAAFATTAAADPGVDATHIVIGQSAPLSGPAAELGRRLRAGILACFRAVNAAGGVDGRKLELLTLDDGYEPARTVVNTRELLGPDAAFALLGFVGTPTTLAAKPLIDAAQIPLIGPFTGADALRRPVDPYVFNLRASYDDETRRIVDAFLFLGLKRVAVFYQDDAYGAAGLSGVRRALAAHGLAPVATGSVQRNTTAVDAALRAILPAHPDLIVQIGTYAESAAFITAARQGGFGGQFANVSFVGAQSLAHALGAAGDGVMISEVVPFPYSGTSAIQRDYAQAMKASGDTTLDFTSFEGYIDARVLVQALRRAGRVPTRAALIASLDHLGSDDLGGYVVHFAPDDHDGSHFVDVTSIDSHGSFRH